MEPSLRESIERLYLTVAIGQIDHPREEALRVVLEAAESWADHIDNEDPEGMQDRTCSTCKHDGEKWTDGHCAKCFYDEFSDLGWEPKE